MKKTCAGSGTVLSFLLLLFFASPQDARAADLNSQDVAAKIVKQDSGVKAQIKDKKQKIAEEREKILAAGRRLSQAKKTGDAALVAQVKKEVDAEIKERKAAISVLKSEIEILQDGGGSLAPGRKGRSKDGQ